ncbi:hypothetical protein JTE90_026521 [Oedothorax gibbosus]|uniref:Uncharacterized protein n=1 Tax=Oedothorax gibbosus TaxID=931172 RepID=A0AAV6VSH5_9ARAC|nr:hypothetical protein JTE90_026521 [Oedothorax gibbosus]
MLVEKGHCLRARGSARGGHCRNRKANCQHNTSPNSRGSADCAGSIPPHGLKEKEPERYFMTGGSVE